MNHDQQLSELRRQEDQLFQKEREIVREKRNLEGFLEKRFSDSGDCSDSGGLVVCAELFSV